MILISMGSVAALDICTAGDLLGRILHYPKLDPLRREGDRLTKVIWECCVKNNLPCKLL